MNAKVLTSVIDKNGNPTRRWMNADQSAGNRASAVGAPPAASGQQPVPISTDIPPTITVEDFMGESHELDTSVWDHSTESVYLRGQCPAFAYNAAKWYPDATIKVAMRGDRVLVHAWLEEDGLMIDAQGAYYYEEEEYIEELFQDWGSVDIYEHTPESLREFVDSNTPSGSQAWDETAYMIPAWLAENVD